MLAKTSETVHVNMQNACVAFTATHAKIVALKSMAKAHDKTVHDGACKDATIKCEDTHGYKICASKEGVDGSDIIDLDFIHANFRGVCYDAHGTTDQIEALREESTSHGVIVTDGACADAHDCHQWKGMTVCKSGMAGTWGDSDTVHAVKNGKCLEIHGAAIKNAAIDKDIAAKLATRGAKLEEHGCEHAGFKKEVYHKSDNNVTVSVWE